MRKLALLLFPALAMLCAAGADASDDILHCGPTRTVDAPERNASPLPINGNITLEAGRGEIALDGDAVLEQGVSASSDGYRVEANQGRYERDKGVLALLGDIQYSGAGADISSEAAVFSYLYGSVEFSVAEFRLGNGASRGAASLLRIDREGKIELQGSGYTSCPPGKDDWLVSARNITLDTENGVGTAKGLMLRFKGVPILYSPYLSFPISTQRKTGFLIPEISRSRRNGLTLGAPWYWNIAPSLDATITPRYLSSRGAQLDTEFRYLTSRSRGDLRFAILPDDNILDIDRTIFEWQSVTDFASRWQGFIDVTDVSDTAYLEDLGGSLNAASATHLNRSLGLRYRGPMTQAEARVTHYQTIDALITRADEPYRLLPQIRTRSLYDKLPLGLELGLDTEFSAFDRDVGVTGNRFHAAPSIALNLEKYGLFFRPKLQWLYTHYRLDETTTDGDTSLTRSMPSAEFMTGLTFERDSGGGRYRQTIEPHLYYVHIPFRNQSAIPVFDTILPIASIEQLYRTNRFVGLDRIGDTDQATFGITTRLISNDDGKSILTATLGQSRYLSDQSVTLPGVDDNIGNSSDYIAELRLNVWGNWNLDLSQQWNSQRSETTKSEVRLQYLPGRDRVFNLGYRFRRDAIDQGDISWSWPISSRWNAVGRYNYSFREDTTLERFFGLEYESCCWGVKIVSRRFISRRDGTSDSAIAIQLELKGLSSVGDSVDTLLENGILGYRTQ